MSDKDREQQLHAMRHSLAHIMATAIQRLWPDVKLGVGPVVENGFYYDVDIDGVQISEEDFDKIEKEMRKIIAEDQPFELSSKSIDEAIVWAKEAKQPYKVELLNDLKREGTTLASELNAGMMGLPAGIVGVTPGLATVADVTFYTNGDFTDLCRGPHVESTGQVGAFKLMRVSGAYWRGKVENPQMQRVYGVAFATEKELRQHLNMLEEAKKRDHRKLGQELDLFVFSPLVGKGLPLWTERGTTLRRGLERFIVDEEIRRGYQHVTTPDIASIELYEKSGHYPYYKDSMYAPIDIDGDKFMLRPMTCPHHFQLYLDKPRTYRDLPMRIAELGKLYRYEQSGELSGLIRARSFTLADSHIICAPDQASQEAGAALDLIEYCADVFGLKKGKDYRYRLSLGDRSDESKYFKDDDAWDNAENVLRELLSKRGEEFEEAEGEAAFYGPKIDIQMRNVTGHEDTAFTVQYDFVMPKRFDLQYRDSDDKLQETVVIHRSSIGAIERMLAFLIEHTAGRFPIWLAPEQIRIATVNQEEPTVKFAQDLVEQARELGLRVKLDNNSESVGKKIRDSEVMKVPYTLVIGEKEIETGMLTPRIRKDIEVDVAAKPISVENFLKTVANEAKSRVSKTSIHGHETSH
jgi:threonyl-tRNA synthetase